MHAVTCIHNRCTLRFTIPDGRFVQVIPEAYQSAHDVDGDGRADVVARYPFAFSDTNGNSLLDAGDIVCIQSPTIRPARPDAPVRWDDTMQAQDAGEIQAAVIRASVPASEYALVD